MLLPLTGGAEKCRPSALDEALYCAVTALSNTALTLTAIDLKLVRKVTGISLNILEVLQSRSTNLNGSRQHLLDGLH